MQERFGATVSTARPSELATNKVLRNTYMLLSATLLFSAVTAGIAIAINAAPLHWLVTIGGYFALLFGTHALRNSPWGLLMVFALTGFMGFTAGNIALISSQKYAKGKYPVLDPEGGRNYQTAFVGPVKTGLYNKPSLGIFSEEQPEIVIDGPTTRNIMTNFPEILSAIQNARIGMYANGLYPEDSGQGSDPTIQALLLQTISTLAQVKKAHEMPSLVSFRSFLEAQEEYDDIQDNVNM